MRSLKLTLCTGAVVVTALTPTAYAAGNGGISVAPAEARPGGDIEVRAKGCEGRTGTATSEAFVADAQLTGKGGGTLQGETRVRSSVEPGTYDVRVTCDNEENKVTGTFEVGDGKPSTPQATPTAPTTPASPVAPVHAGGGGAAARLAAAGRAADPADTRHADTDTDTTTDTGPGARQAVVGLVLAGVAAVVVVARGARRGRGTE
ncbi:hypothetical protein SGFS_047850 [Streptomyces graminofaciens]|uniref:Secreted protein n=1 Tax=Streptomyces graminofaciens TaxID=68212 RepID=A0ABN5VJH4_9ACTN|nr:hypothetical protein [Streptomyces graminofaciens]BBC33491.1 hypothetical protein SGFS_047850 [Streptomyces graminofaciens]